MASDQHIILQLRKDVLTIVSVAEHVADRLDQWGDGFSSEDLEGLKEEVKAKMKTVSAFLIDDDNNDP